ncbi:MAG TPA: VWA domain-containing protein [Woeseiaceae bacterium]|nr:VWA domain-containing protein [Woeseiaceae bacterium]
MPTEFHWIRPEWLLALPLIALLVLIMARRQLAPGSWQRVVDPVLAPYVLSRSPGKAGSARWWLMLLGGILAVLALAGPSWNRLEQPVFRTEQAIVIALDLSQSMDAEDLTPSRLTRARLKILELLERRQSGQTALVVYSANAFTVSPLTTDSDTVAALVNSLSTDIMPSRGSYPAAAIDKGRDLLQQAGVGHGQVLLITDGGASEEAERAAAELSDAGYTLSILGVGTLDGAPIPRPDGGFVTDRAGRIAIPRLESDGLRSLAAAGGGRYAVMTADNRDIESLVSDAAEDPSAADDSQATDQWREEGPWLLLLLVPLAALAFRRGWVLAFAVVCVIPLSQPAEASVWQDLWQTKDQQAEKKLAEGDAAEAARLFDDPTWRAVAHYRSGEYGESADGFRQQDNPPRGDADGLYNQGNALARAGQFESAIDAYERALEIDPGAEDAAYNRDQVREFMEQKNAQSGEQGNQESPSESGGESEQSDGQSQSEQQGEEGASGESGDESEQSSSRGQDEMSQEDLEALQQELDRAAQQAEQQPGESKEAMSEAELLAERRAQEQTQALEQWLRRIPNDPGGLLRRKFRYQYQRQGMDQDGNNLWPDDEIEPW